MCITDAQKSILADKVRLEKVLNLTEIRKAIPEEAFVKSAVKGFYHMFFDYALIFGAIYGLAYANETGIMASLPQWQQYAIAAVAWNVAGFFMWGIFVVGHDCGHGTFSNSEILNDIVGHICHGSILVPYYPWQLSHRRHHMYHNHIDKDYSHPWYTPDKLEKEDEHLARMMEKFPFIRFFFPFIGWQLYLYGMPDGSHWIPFSSQRMWAESEVKEYKKCILSTLVVLANCAAIYFICGQNLMNVAYYYLPPYMVFGWWLVTVTYLQHHDHDTLVYDEHDWKFVDAAFETVDRKFGFGIDYLHHHITDGHVIHHLFFTKIPHYNLPVATEALRSYLKDNKLDFLYKFDITYDFPIRVHKYMVQFGLGAKRATPLVEAKKGK